MSGIKPFVWGGIASISAEIVSFPFDLTKTRLQLQGQIIDSTHSKLKYRGMLHAFVTIPREEGLMAFYNGLSPAVLRQAVYGTLKMGFYNYLKKLLLQNRNESTLAIDIVCGMFSGGLAGFIASPTDLLKVRWQAAAKDAVKPPLIKSFIEIYRTEGIQGLYRGSAQTMERAAIVTGVELAVYDWAKRLILRHNLGSDNIVTHFWASVAAGLGGTLTTSPIDVIRTRLMNQKKLLTGGAANEGTIYKGAFDCLQKTVRAEGYLALYKGFFPLWFRLAPWNTTVSFGVVMNVYFETFSAG